MNPYTPPVTPPTNEFAPCPKCQGTDAKRIPFTAWGGALGPWMLTHVRCTKCGSAYNGKTGRWNTTSIIIYIVVSGVIVLLLLGASLVPALMK